MLPARTLVVSLTMLLAVPAVAGAATEVRTQVIQGLDVVVVVDQDTAAQIDTARGIEEGTGNKFLAVQSNQGAVPGSGCVPAGANIVGCYGDFDAVLVYGNGGNDKVSMDLIADGFGPLHGEAYGGLGDDELRSPPDNRDVPQPTTYMDGEAGNDTVVGGNGADELHGGDGNDAMQAFEGADVVRGEGGDDKVSAGKEEPEANAADVLDGGPGFDENPDVDPDYNRGFDDDVSVTQDGQANDGEAGEGDNVTSVEKMRVVADNATVVGTDGADDIFVEGYSSTIRGMGGSDKLVAYDGHDTIEGGDGDDYLEGGFGNDTLDGGAGVDQFNGDRTEQYGFAAGSDRIHARDGNAEQIDCGIGGDSAVVDASDIVSLSCEDIDRGGFGPKTLVTLKLANARIPARGPLPVRIANANDFAVTGSVAGQTTKPVSAQRKRRVKLKAKRFSVAAKSAKTVKLKLPAALKRTLRRTGRLSLRLTVKLTDPAGNKRTVKKKVTAKVKR